MEFKQVEQKILSRDDWLPHEVAEMSIVLKGQPLSLKKYKLMYPLYDNACRKTLFVTARQVSKSTSLANIMTMRCFFKKFYSSLFIAPLEQQVYRFSNLYVKPLLKGSPILRARTDAESVRSVLVKSFTNGSIMHFGYCQNGVDRIRGISADEINWDEVQDILYDNIPIVQECLGASSYKFQRFCGTPKSFENTMHYLWNSSSQHEPVVRCSRCNKDNIPDLDHAFDMIAEDGPKCCHCDRLFRLEDIISLCWVAGRKEREDYFVGYHIPRIFISEHLEKNNWRDIWEKFSGSNYSKAQFANEVLGLSYDLAGRLITLSDLQGLCHLEKADYKKLNKHKYINICAGVDWGISAVTSFTVIIIIALRSDLKWEVLHWYKFPHADTIRQIREIVQLLRMWKVDAVGCDHGVGHHNNQELRAQWSPGDLMKVSEYNYVKAKFLLSWRKADSRFSLNRTMSLNSLFFDMKKQNILFPTSGNLDDVFDHILAEYEEISEGPFGMYKVFRHAPEVPDDYLHALNFAQICSKREAGMVMYDYDIAATQHDTI